jgi:hypothetical protein
VDSVLFANSGPIRLLGFFLESGMEVWAPKEGKEKHYAVPGGDSPDRACQGTAGS